jgi:S1-C subfamily serine protease
VKKLGCIFAVALFFTNCGTYSRVIDVSYDPIDYPPQFFSSKDKRPVLYIAPIIDGRENSIAVNPPGMFEFVMVRSGRFKEDPTLIYHNDTVEQHFVRTSKTPSGIILEALEVEVSRFGIKITKDRGMADGILNAYIEEFRLNTFDKSVKVIVKINLKLYKAGINNPAWSGTLKGSPGGETKPLGKLNTALSMAIKQWHSYPGFQEAMVSLSGSNSSQPSFQPTVPRPSIKQQAVSGGTGFLFSSKDYVITNYHVVKGAGSILAKFTNGQTVRAVVVAKDSKNDIAILKLENSPPLSAVPIKLGDSSQARAGEKIFTIGYPASKIMGEKPKYSEGVINSMTGLKDDPAFFQVSVPVQPGNSGGPLFNVQGEVIGITTASLSLLAIDAMGAIPQNVNYAIKSSFVKNLLSTIPELLLSNTGIVVVPNEPGNSLPKFIEQASKNIVLIEAKE